MKYDYLVNPANVALIGTRFAYFPVGGPVPPVPEDTALESAVFASSRWGGMSAGENMMYPVEVLDGQVHELGGHELFKYLQELPILANRDDAGQQVRCNIGQAISSPAYGNLSSLFGEIIHTVPPFMHAVDWETQLFDCYTNSFKLAFKTRSESVASVVLGAGCRNIPFSDAARIAAHACEQYKPSSPSPSIQQDAMKSDGKGAQVHFILRETNHAISLSDAFDACEDIQKIDIEDRE
jgi:O-acetyl-ADP-ribose deacetylase (regulator of RNase III)